MKNSSVFPGDLLKLADKFPDSIYFSASDIAEIISNLIKVEGHNMLCIQMIKLCGNSVYKLLSMMFNDCMNEGKYSSEWKKVNFVPLHKKIDNLCAKNYMPISLLPIRSKILDCLDYNEMFTFFTGNNLISPNQLGFK